MYSTDQYCFYGYNKDPPLPPGKRRLKLKNLKMNKTEGIGSVLVDQDPLRTNRDTVFTEKYWLVLDFLAYDL